MPCYAFAQPVQPGTMDAWKGYVAEMKGPRKAEYDASRQRAGLREEEVWLQHTPMGDFAIVHLEADDIGRVFQTFMTSQEPFDVWFRDNVLVGVHGMDMSAAPPPMNEPIFGV